MPLSAEIWQNRTPETADGSDGEIDAALRFRLECSLAKDLRFYDACRSALGVA